jgi:hypothetical protein
LENKEEAISEVSALKMLKDPRYEYRYDIDVGIKYEMQSIERIEETEANQTVINIYITGERYIG